MASFLPVLFYLAAAVFVLGLAWRIATWLRAPVPLKIPVTPGPATYAGVARRLGGELLLFRSLWRADKTLWAAGWIFHVALVLLAFGHVGGLVCPEFPRRLLGLTAEGYARMSLVTGGAIGILAIAPLFYLALRRRLLERVRYISTFGDFLALGLLFLVIATGDEMRFQGAIDLAQAREFVAGLLAFRPVPPPGGFAFTAHMLSVCALLAYIPFSKLVHLGGVFFNPTLNQRNNARELRHINP